MSWDLQWVRDMVARKLDFDPDEPDEAFGGTSDNVWSAVDAWIQEAYNEIITDAILEAPEDVFKVYIDLTWAADSSTLVLPKHVAYSKSLQMYDITNDSTNPREEFVYASSRQGGIYWLDRLTLSWPSSAGPTDAKTYRWFYLADAEELILPTQTPLLIPYRYRYLLVWKAALNARIEVDEDNGPALWRQKVEQLKESYHIDLCQGRLSFSIPPRIENRSLTDHVGVTL